MELSDQELMRWVLRACGGRAGRGKRSDGTGLDSAEYQAAPIVDICTCTAGRGCMNGQADLYLGRPSGSMPPAACGRGVKAPQPPTYIFRI